MTKTNSEKRANARLRHETEIAIEKDAGAGEHPARMINYSNRGACIESDLYLAPGTRVTLRIQNSPFTGPIDIPEIYRAEIKWRKFIDDSVFDFGYGLMIQERVPLPERPGTPAVESRRHARKPCSVPTLIQGWEQPIRGVIENVGPGGVFIRCQGSPAVGQRVSLAIPIRKTRRLVVRTGEIVRSQSDGIGIRLDPTKPATPEKP
ncbi:MAG: PilZ domain-containing protein [Desulfobacterales bacterium]